MLNKYVARTLVMSDGERFCLVTDHSTGMPLYHPNLYLTTQLRNRSVSFNTLQREAINLSMMLSFFDEYGLDIEKRFRTGRFLQEFEIDAMRDFLQEKKKSKSEASKRKAEYLHMSSIQNRVSDGDLYVRLTTAHRYCGWLARYLLDDAGQEVVDRIQWMAEQIKARRPRRVKGSQDRIDRSLSDEQVETLIKAVQPGSETNPFHERVQKRNQILIHLLLYLGIRGGELLNIRIQDLDFNANRLRIVRRPDSKDDPRGYEPNVKTLERYLPLKGSLAKSIHDYIVYDRRNVKNSGRHDFLFITYKEGPTEGQPLSKSSYNKIFKVLRATFPELRELTGHMLRHTWNHHFSRMMDQLGKPLSETEQERLRSYLMGWKEGSGTAAVYNKRFIREKAQEFALRFQTKIPGI